MVCANSEKSHQNSFRTFGARSQRRKTTHIHQQLNQLCTCNNDTPAAPPRVALLRLRTASCHPHCTNDTEPHQAALCFTKIAQRLSGHRRAPAKLVQTKIFFLVRAKGASSKRDGAQRTRRLSGKTRCETDDDPELRTLCGFVNASTLRHRQRHQRHQRLG